MGSQKIKYRDRYILINPVDEYLSEVEKIWPRENYIWSEEFALGFLMQNDYNVEGALDKIKSNHLDFTDCLDSNIKLIQKNNYIGIIILIASTLLI